MRLLITLCLFIVTILVSGQAETTLDVQGHRGARGLKPENTLPAIEVALDLGVTTIELDMHYSADNHVVIWHDAAMSRESCYLPETSDFIIPTPDSLIFGDNPLRIRVLTVDEIKEFICDMNPNASQFPEQNNQSTDLAGDNYSMLTLNEVFAFVEEYANSSLKTDAQRENAQIVRFNLESKRKANDAKAIDDDFDGETIGAFELAIIAVIDEFDMRDRVTIQSFDHRILGAIHADFPDITLAALTSQQRPQFESYVEDGVTIWSPNYSAVTDGWIADAHELGIQVIPWTVNDASDMTQLIDMGVDGIITDFPDILLDVVGTP